MTETAQRKFFRSDRRVPLDSVIRFRQTLSDVASLFLHNALTMFQRRLNMEKISVTKEVSFFWVGNEDVKLQNGDRQFTKAFRYLKDVLYHILPTSVAFSEIICDRLWAFWTATNFALLLWATYCVHFCATYVSNLLTAAMKSTMTVGRLIQTIYTDIDH